ncbi:SET domain-containing protein [Paraflavisolibacter sp. H34]|uniref:SET domain-containing protein n=1 Tax=Huijunlia imazamoxiresistens TaxID=3127457 RepID=UPI00301A3FD9
MKPISFLLDSVFVARTKTKGRGIFCNAPIEAKTIIEIAPVIVLSAPERKQIDETLLHDYIFEWGDDRKKCCMALGYVPLYNHASPSNCEYEMDFRKKLITIMAVRDIEAGEELFINYNGDWSSKTPVWFETL